MKVETKKEGNLLTLIAEGSIDTATAPDFEDCLEKNLDGINELNLDFSKVSFLSSAGLRVIILAYKKMPADNRKVVVKNASDEIKEVLGLTGMDKFLVIE